VLQIMGCDYAGINSKLQVGQVQFKYEMLVLAIGDVRRE
jgi:hypothetical protein